MKNPKTIDAKYRPGRIRTKKILKKPMTMDAEHRPGRLRKTTKSK